MVLLQQNVIIKGTDTLFQYGVLGVFAILLILAVWYLEKQRRSKELSSESQRQEDKAQIKRLEDRFDEYQRTDRVRMEKLIQENTQVMERVLEKVTNFQNKQ